MHTLPPTVGRIAPSPTGRMHLGNAYSALAAWLGARSVGGQIVLRIEDIDAPRMVKDADRWIMDDLAWLGLDWDGEPLYQSARYDVYEDVLADLSPQRFEGESLTYPCFCTRAQLHAASAPQESDGFVIYPGTCRPFATTPPADLASRRHATRLIMPRPGSPDSHATFDDAVFGHQDWDLPCDVGDIVLRRSDGPFAYQLAVVVDDLAQGVTQIVRGRDLLRSAAAQTWLRRQVVAVAPELLATPESPSPQYAHLPLLLDPDGRRMSKRYGSLELATLRDQGVSAQQVIGYLAYLLGLQDSPEPRDAVSLIECFTWNIVRNAGISDKCTDPSILTR